MKELKEKIIQAVQDATDIVDGTVSIPILEHFLDGILTEQCSKVDVVGRSEQLCQHEWIDARNEFVKSGYVCLKCNSVKA